LGDGKKKKSQIGRKKVGNFDTMKNWSKKNPDGTREKGKSGESGPTLGEGKENWLDVKERGTKGGPVEHRGGYGKHKKCVHNISRKAREGRNTTKGKKDARPGTRSKEKERQKKIVNKKRLMVFFFEKKAKKGGSEPEESTGKGGDACFKGHLKKNRGDRGKRKWE